MKNRIIRAVSALLLFVVAISLAFTASAENIDYSRPGSSLTNTLYAGDLIEEALSVSLSDAEKRYLELYCDFSITLPSTISSSYVKTEYDEEKKSLSVSVMPYVYELSCGTKIEWIPSKAVLWDREKLLEKNGDGYVCTFDGVNKRQDNKENAVSVLFEYEIIISEKAFNSFLNKAYFDIPMLKEEHKKRTQEYEAALLEYEKNKSEYADYLEALSVYNAEYEIYQKYLEEKRIYDEKYAEFLDYKAELEKFNQDVIAYENYEKELLKFESDYLSYLTYLDNAEKYDKELLKYQKYLADIETVRAQINTLDQIKTYVTDLKRSTYSDIMGNTVTSVIENKTLIVKTFGVDAETVDLAGSATERLRTLFDDYFSFTEESDKYSYYVMNYEKFRDNFCDLLRALDKLYENEGVTDTLRTQEKEEKYVILLAQLYKISNALSSEKIYNYDGTAAFDENYIIQNYYSKFPKNDSFYDKYKVEKKPSDVIAEEDYYVDIENPVPIDGGYPNEVLEPEILVTEEPTRPAFMKKPIEPQKVSEPEKINEVKEPEKLDEVLKPRKPDEYVADEAILNLIDEGFSVPMRESVSTDVVLTQSINVKKQFIGAATVNVAFHDQNGNELFSTAVDKGTPADFYGKIPVKAEDESATYTFECWVDEDGNVQNLDEVEADMHLYPKFRKTLKKYEVTWILDGEEISEKYDYGTAPSCPIVPEKVDTGTTYYTFDGFDKPVVPVTENATYTAKFKENYFIAYESGGGAPISYADGVCTVNAAQDNAKGYDISHLVEKIAGKYSLQILTRYGNISFSYSDTLLLKKEKAASFSLLVNMVGNGAYEYRCSLFDTDGNEILERISVNLDLPCKLPNTERMTLYHYLGENKKQVSYTVNETNIRYKATCGVTYFAGCEYKVSIVPCEILSLSVDKTVANHGSAVFVNYIPKKGISVNGTYYVSESGERVYFEGYFTLTENVTVGIDYSYIEYTVSFVSDGKVINSNTYHYGDMPKAPQNPKKPSDGSYTYSFIDWSSEIAPVTSDAVYEARYRSSPVQKEEEKLIKISDRILGLLLLGAGSGFIVVFGGVPCLIISVNLRKKTQKNKADEPERNA